MQGPALTKSKEQILNDLNAVTAQYLSCADLREAAARRQRVILSDNSDLLETTANSILAAEAIQRRPLSSWERGIKSVSPPADNSILGLRPEQMIYNDVVTPTRRMEDEFGLYPNYSEAIIQRPSPDHSELRVASTRIRSIIISPTETGPDLQTQSNGITATQEEETSKELQHKEKKKTTRLLKARSPRLGPNILRGASSKKRKLSQLHNSPGGSKRSKTDVAGSTQTSSNPSTSNASAPLIAQTLRNPPIQLIPAMAKKSSDFRAHPPQGP